ncbi:efflux RND transporter periplasmic adaptor subunit [Pseudorhodoferax sp.]|uniref:efflux RND transporter periplasmic adaptor subunit n=1 Tax=Pseudorhodoferax sp. TaxID=1993553 RepID=UPI002DD6478F|nr:efflux RND transporter periplasmic adaptor subunit [Pseudorhodoferax sp.]
MTTQSPSLNLNLGAVLALLAAAASASAQTAPATAARPPAATGARLLDCMIQPHQVVQIGSPVPGVIDSITVDRGDIVRSGQAVAHLASGVERAALAVARERAEQQGEVAVANSSAALAQRELRRAAELYQQAFVSQTYLDRSRAEAQVAGGRTEQAMERRKLAQREVELAAAQLQQRTLRSPIDGVVVERFMSPGEFIDQKPVLRIAGIDPLRVDVLVPASAFGRIQSGMQGKVVPELLNRSERVAVVKTVDRVVDAATNTFRVRLELPNPRHELPAGLRCKVDLGIEMPAAAVLPSPVAAR